MSNINSNSATIRPTMFSSTEAPRLRGILTKSFIEFRKLRQPYEKHVNDKNPETRTNIALTSHKSSIEDADMRISIAAEWINATSVGLITNIQIRQCIEDKCHRILNGEQLHILNDSTRNFVIKMHIFEAEDRIWTLHRDHLTALGASGYEEIPERKPHIAIQHIVQRLKPPQLKNRMKSIVKWRKDEGFDKKDFNKFMREVVSQAKKLQEEKTAFDSRYLSGSDTDNEQQRSRKYTARKTYHGKRPFKQTPFSHHSKKP